MKKKKKRRLRRLVAMPLANVSLTHISVGDERISPRLSGLWADFVENHVEFFNGTAFLRDFQELKPFVLERTRLKSLQTRSRKR